MKTLAALSLFLAAGFGLGCSASSAGSMGAPPSGSGGGNSGGGGSGAKADAANAADAGSILLNGDAGPSRTVPVGASVDGPSFNWDTLQCSGCAGNGGPGGNGSGGASGTAASGGAAGSTSAAGSGGRSGGAGGVSGRGGALGSGGRATSADAGIPPGAGGSAASGAGGQTGAAGGSVGVGGSYGAGGNAAAGGSFGGRDAGPPREAGGGTFPDASPAGDASGAGPDAGTGGAGVPCTASIVSLVPATTGPIHLVAGVNASVVLRAQATSGGPPAGTRWSWQAWYQGQPLPAAGLGTQDPSAATFAIANAGDYTFTATAGACSATASARAAGINSCSDCDNYIYVRAAPPPTLPIPVQMSLVDLRGGLPNLMLDSGAAVLVAPSVSGGIVSAYVRINDPAGALVTDGLADPAAGGFNGRVLSLDPDSHSPYQYDVLVVPLGSNADGSGDAAAPQLYQNRAAADIDGAFSLSGGVTLSGTTLSVSGQPVVDVRVMLTNQNPTSVTPPAHLLFSSVGRSDGQGNYSLQVQPGTYWVSFSPPPGSGLSEAMGMSPITIGGATTLSFQWNQASTATLSLQVNDATNAGLGGVDVRATSSQSSAVGTISFGSTSQPGTGNVQVEGTTDATGKVTFANLPAEQSYDLLMVPASPGPASATTQLSVNLPAGGAATTVQLLRQSTISGRLTAGSTALNFGSVVLVAYDRSADSPEPPRSIVANPDGTFAFGVTPGRSYVLLAVPPADSGYARTFVGPGPMQASEFTITQNLLGAMPWSATVIDQSNNGLSGTALQVFCKADYPGCVDGTVPLAETTSQAGGAFALTLQDPKTRQ